MIKKWLFWINLGMGGVISLLLINAFLLFIARSEEIAATDSMTVKRPLSTPAFAMSKEACDTIGKTAFELKYSPAALQLPDLRNHLVFLGKNGRPDAAHIEKPVLHFGISSNSNAVASTLVGERLYLLYDRQKTPGQYIFSPENVPTSFWIEASLQGNEAVVKVRMHNEDNEIVHEPAAYALFTLSEKESARMGNNKPWEIGKWRVDGSLLARQKARWTGLDRFLERHGGPEFNHMSGKHRIDFANDEEVYSVFIGINDSLIWEKDRWRAIQPGQESLGYPLMVIKKIDDRIMNLELWDVGGKSKVILNLIKINEAWSSQNLQDKFKFMGARTRSQYIFDVDNERILLSPQDWLLQTSEGWIKLTTTQQIDDYVDRKLVGVLFVFEGIIHQEDKQVLKGVIFNAARTEMQEVEIPIQGNARLVSSKENKETKSNVEEDSDDDDDDDDDDEEEEEEDKKAIIKSKLKELKKSVDSKEAVKNK